MRIKGEGVRRRWSQKIKGANKFQDFNQTRSTVNARLDVKILNFFWICHVHRIGAVSEFFFFFFKERDTARLGFWVCLPDTGIEPKMSCPCNIAKAEITQQNILTLFPLSRLFSISSSMSNLQLVPFSSINRAQLRSQTQNGPIHHRCYSQKLEWSNQMKKKPTQVKTSHLVFRCILTEFMTNIPTHYSHTF